MALTDADIEQIRALIRDELDAVGFPSALTFEGNGKRVTVVSLPDGMIYNSRDILTDEIREQIRV
jgi:hypothetical protein